MRSIHKSEIISKRNKLAEQLENYLRNNKLTCVPITINGKNLYLRLMKTINHKQIGESTITQALNAITYDNLVKISEQMKTEDDNPVFLIFTITSFIIDSIKNSCEVIKESATINETKERLVNIPKLKKKKRKVETESIFESILLPEDIKQDILEFYHCN